MDERIPSHQHPSDDDVSAFCITKTLPPEQQQQLTPPSSQQTSTTSCKQQHNIQPITVTASPDCTNTVVVVVTNPAAFGSTSLAVPTTTTTVTISVSKAPSDTSSPPALSHTADNEMTNYNLDHLYCHPNEKGSPKVTVSPTPPRAPSTPPQSALATTMQLQQQPPSPQYHNQRADAGHLDAAPTASTGPEMTTVLREIKHLKEMLMMHLDLIQEQNDQLIMRDKQMLALRKDNDILRARLAKHLAAKPMLTDDHSDEPEPQRPPPQAVATKSSPQPPSMFAVPLAAADYAMLTPLATDSITAVHAVDLPSSHNETGPYSLDHIAMNVMNRRTTQLDTLTYIMAGVGGATGGRQHRHTPSPAPSAAVMKPTAIATVATNHTVNSNPLSQMQSNATAPAAASNQSIVQAITSRTLQSSTVGNESSMQSVAASGRIDIFEGTTADLDDGIMFELFRDNDDEFLPTSEANPTPDRDQKQSEDKPGRSQNSRRRRKQHDSIGMSRKRRRTHLQTSALKSSASVDDSVTTIVHTAVSATEHPSGIPEDGLTTRPPSAVAAAATTRSSFITTSNCYTTRQWFMDEVATEVDQQLAEFIVDDQAAAASAASSAVVAAAAACSVVGQPTATRPDDTPQLELPCWSIKPVIATSDASDTEDFSPSVFQRRHARFELDERKRKKWDIQRIREQRNVERLRRRQNRDELPEQPKGIEELGTFYPAADQVLWVQVTDELPVLAFGELVPVLPNIEFGLPWQTPSASESSPELLHQLPTVPPSNVLPRSSHERYQQPSYSACFGGGHTTIVYAKKKATRRYHHQHLAEAPAAVTSSSYTNSSTAIPCTAATAAGGVSASNAAVPVARTNVSGSGGAKLGRGHSGVHSKRSGGGRRNKR